MELFKKKKKGGMGSEINISSTKVRVEIKRMMGKVPITIASFEATQQRDEVKNLVLISAEGDFKEDANFTQQKIMSSLQTSLEMSSLSMEKKLASINNKLEVQNKIVRSIKDGYALIDEKKTKVNVIEEENKLKLYKMLKFHFTHYGEGSYEEVDKDGFRKVSFKFQEGIFYPYYICDDGTTMYADMTTKRKIYKQEQDLIDLDYMNENKHFLSGWKGIAVLAFCLLFLFGNMFFAYKLAGLYNEWDQSNIADLIDKAEGSAINCAYYYATIGEETAKFINAVDKEDLKEESGDSKNIDLR